jgi:hypothetical protein
LISIAAAVWNHGSPESARSRLAIGGTSVTSNTANPIAPTATEGKSVPAIGTRLVLAPRVAGRPERGDEPQELGLPEARAEGRAKPRAPE